MTHIYESLEKNEMLQLSSDKSHVKVQGQFQAAKNGKSVKLNGPETEQSQRSVPKLNGPS